jgi:ATP-binding cassette subfamily F protein 3
LFLDEPTNHLDIPAGEILEEALIGFSGTVILVSHDRRFLENVTTRTMSFTDGKVDLFEGGFRDYGEALDRIRRAEAEPERPARRRDRTPPTAERVTQSGTKGNGETGETKVGAEAHKARRDQARELERKRRQVEALERRSAELESDVAHYKKLLREASGSNWEELHEWAKKERELSGELEKVLAAWMSLSEEIGSPTREGSPP